MEINRVNGDLESPAEPDPLANEPSPAAPLSRGGLEIFRINSRAESNAGVKVKTLRGDGDWPPCAGDEVGRKRLKEEIEGLKWLAKKKEEEWDNVLSLMKFKERSLLKLERKIALEQSNAKTVVSTSSVQRPPAPTIVHSQLLSPAMSKLFEDGEDPCDYCRKKEAEFECANCGRKKYCSRDCQLSHWSVHSTNCAPSS